MKKILWFIMFAFTSLTMIAQNDTIFTEDQIISCIIKEVTLNDVIFIYPGEKVKNLIEKNKIQKIIYKSGQVESFTDSITYKKVNGPEDFNNVSIIRIKTDTAVLFQLGEVSSKTDGKFTGLDLEKVKIRAYYKLNIQAAMLGANIVYLTQQKIEAREPGSYSIKKATTYYGYGQSPFTKLKGIAYSNMLPKFEDFQNLIGDSSNFEVFEEISFYIYDKDITKKNISKNITINKVWNENGLIMLDAKINGVKNNIFRVISFDVNRFTVMYRSQYTIYNFRVKF